MCALLLAQEAKIARQPGPKGAVRALLSWLQHHDIFNSCMDGRSSIFDAAVFIVQFTTDDVSRKSFDDGFLPKVHTWQTEDDRKCRCCTACA